MFDIEKREIISDEQKVKNVVITKPIERVSIVFYLFIYLILATEI